MGYVKCGPFGFPLIPITWPFCGYNSIVLLLFGFSQILLFLHLKTLVNVIVLEMSRLYGEYYWNTFYIWNSKTVMCFFFVPKKKTFLSGNHEGTWLKTNHKWLTWLHFRRRRHFNKMHKRGTKMTYQKYAWEEPHTSRASCMCLLTW